MAHTAPPPSYQYPAVPIELQRSISNFYGSWGLGFQGYYLSRPAPDADPSATINYMTDLKYQLPVLFILGWGPLSFKKLLFNTHYIYNQNWETDTDQLRTFYTYWFNSPQMDTFVFPTRSLSRAHSLSFDMRFVNKGLQIGVFSRLQWERAGSTYIGESFERTETTTVSENFTPYLAYLYNKFYRIQLSIPFKTEINKEDSRLSYQMYSYNIPLASVDLNQALYIKPIKMLIYNQLFYRAYKYSSLTNDQTHYGVSLGMDSPLFWKIRIKPQVTYIHKTYSLGRLFRPRSSSAGQSLVSVINRNDEFIRGGAGLELNLTPRWRWELNYSYDTNFSSLPLYESQRHFAAIFLTYSLPSTEQTVKMTHRFLDENYAQDF